MQYGENTYLNSKNFCSTSEQRFIINLVSKYKEKFFGKNRQNSYTTGIETHREKQKPIWTSVHTHSENQIHKRAFRQA